MQPTTSCLQEKRLLGSIRFSASPRGIAGRKSANAENKKVKHSSVLIAVRLMLALCLVLSISACSRKAGNDKAEGDSMEQLAFIEWEKTNDGPMPPEFLVKFKESKGKPTSTATAATSPAAPPPVATPPVATLPSAEPPPATLPPAAKTPSISQNNAYAGMSFDERELALEREARIEWDKSYDGPCPPEYIARYKAAKANFLAKTTASVPATSAKFGSSSRRKVEMSS